MFIRYILIDDVSSDIQTIFRVCFFIIPIIFIICISGVFFDTDDGFLLTMALLYCLLASFINDGFFY